MWQKIKAFVVKHKYISIGLGLVAVFVFLYFSGILGGSSSSSSSSTASGTPDDTIQAAEIQANAAIQAASIAAGVQNNSTNSQTTLGLGYLQEQIALANSNNEAAIDALQITTGANVVNEEIAGLVAVKGLPAGTSSSAAAAYESKIASSIIGAGSGGAPASVVSPTPIFTPVNINLNSLQA